MKLVVLVMPTIRGLSAPLKYKEFAELLGPTPVGVKQAGDNVWLVDTDIALSFIITFTLRARECALDFELFDSVPS